MNGSDAHKEPYFIEEPEPAAGEPSAPPQGPSPDANSGQEKTMCPECGAEMDGDDDACIRCGFSRIGDGGRSTVAAKQPDRSAPVDDVAERSRPISPSGRHAGFEFWLPAILGLLALIILTVAHLAGASGLFPQVRVDEAVTAAPWGMRLSELLRTLVLLLFWTGCGLAGLFGMALMFERPLGDARVAALRMAAIMATVRLATLVMVPGPRWMEWMTESILQAAGFVLLSILLFRLAIRNATVLALWTLMAILVLWLFTFAVQWALAG